MVNLAPTVASAVCILTCNTVPSTLGGVLRIGDEIALNVPVPPVSRKSKLFSTPALHGCDGGVIVSVSGGGAAVPSAFVTVGGVVTVRPVASVMVNVPLTTHVPFVVTVNPPPLR